MYHKVKNTLASLAIAMTMLGLSYSVGQAPLQATAAAPQLDLGTSRIEASLDRVQMERKRARGMQSQLSMPFYSFAPLLPRRES